jgi:hypothetical protein
MPTTLDRYNLKRRRNCCCSSSASYIKISIWSYHDDIEASDKCWQTVTNPVLAEDGTKKFIVVGCRHESGLALALEDDGHY